MRFDGKTTKRKVTKYSLDELSTVPTGAQAPAKMAIIKTSSDQMREKLNTVLLDKFDSRDNHVWVHDYDDEFVVYYDSKRTYAIGYSMQDGQVTLVGERIPVQRLSFYESDDGSRSFFKTVARSVLAGYELDETMYTAIAKSDETDAVTLVGSVEDQVTAIALQFGKAATKTVGGRAYPASDFAFVPDPEKPSTWKLPIFDGSHVSAAVAALGKGFRGKKVSIPEADRGKVLTAVRAAYREHFPDKDLPDVLNKSGDPGMPDPKTAEQLQKELDAANAQNAELHVLAKASDAEKSFMANMSDDEKKTFLALSADERKAKMKTAKAADESFVDTLGQKICKSEIGENAYAIMKSQNERLAKMEDDAANAQALELVKAICPELPGTPEEKAGAIRKAQGALTADEFGVLEKALKAGDAAMKVRKEPAGHQQETGNEGAKQAYDDGIAKLMSDKGISKVQAMQAPEGLKLAKTLRDAEAE